MVKLAEYNRTASFAWSKGKIPSLVTGTASGTVDAEFSTDSTLELWSLLSASKDPVTSIKADAKFNDIDWSIDNKYIAGALDNGVVELYQTNAKDSLESVAKFTKHETAVSTVRFNAKQENVLASGSKNGEIFIWDLKKCIGASASDYTPLTPGMAMSPIEEISSLAWNQSLSHVFASAGNTSYASIWDLKAKKEVIHLSYTSPNSSLKPQLSVVEWHPENSTRVATASNSDNEPIILIWDLRNANTPLQILSNGNSKGVLSLDWCKKDADILLSSGRDNTVVLWNPETGNELTQFPARSNWCFKTKFAPEAPNLFACASFDGKVEIQTLQNLENVFDQQENASKQKESETDFWNNVSNEESTEKPTVFEVQAPAWYGNKSPAAQWAFGGKLVQITNDGKNVSVTTPHLPGLPKNSMLDDALKSKDFSSIINQRLTKTIDDTNEEDWNMLEKLSVDGKEDFLKEALAFDDEIDESSQDEKAAKEKKEMEEGEEFFAQVESKFEPSGTLKLDKDLDQQIARSLIKDNTKAAVVTTLKNDMLLEAMLIALDSDDKALKESVKQAYFTKYAKESALSRFLYSTSENDVSDLVENIDVTQWRYAAKAVFTFCKDDVEKRNTLLIKIGDRLLKSDNRQDAIVLYLAADSIDKIASIWVKEFSTLETKVKENKDTVYEAHSETLAEFVERFTVFSSFVGADSNITNEDLISKFMEFVNITSASGNFDLAYTFLETLPGSNEEVATEKERVLLASGKSTGTKTTHNYNARNVPQLNNTTSNPTIKKAFPSTTSVNAYTPTTPQTNSFNPPVPHHQQQFVAQPPTPSVPFTPVAKVNNPYTPNAPVTQTTGKYAPVANVTPSTFEQRKPATVTPSVVNPYMPTNVVPVPNFISNNNPLSNANELPPPPITKSGASGQTPHLNRKANDGWNDLPIGVKESSKPARAKAVSVQPSSSGSQSPGTYFNNQNPLAPPPASRHASNSALTSLPPPAKGVRKASSHTTSSYAPQENVPIPSPHNGLNNNNVGFNSNPYAPSSGTNSIASPTVNPYAPSSNMNGGPVPSNPYAPNKMNGNVAPPTQQNPYVNPTTASVSPQRAPQPLAPPPINARKKASKSTTPIQGDISSISTTAPIASTAAAAGTTTSETANVTDNVQELTEEEQGIIDFFKQELERVSPLIPQEYSKQLKDCKKRLNILFKHLQNHDLLTAPTEKKLSEITSLMKATEYSKAMEIYVDIANNHAHEGGNWLTGVKRLIGISEALGA